MTPEYLDQKRTLVSATEICRHLINPLLILAGYTGLSQVCPPWALCTKGGSDVLTSSLSLPLALSTSDPAPLLSLIRDVCASLSASSTPSGTPPVVHPAKGSPEEARLEFVKDVARRVKEVPENSLNYWDLPHGELRLFYIPGLTLDVGSCVLASIRAVGSSVEAAQQGEGSTGDSGSREVRVRWLKLMAQREAHLVQAFSGSSWISTLVRPSLSTRTLKVLSQAATCAALPLSSWRQTPSSPASVFDDYRRVLSECVSLLQHCAGEVVSEWSGNTSSWDGALSKKRLAEDWIVMHILAYPLVAWAAAGATCQSWAAGKAVVIESVEDETPLALLRAVLQCFSPGAPGQVPYPALATCPTRGELWLQVLRLQLLRALPKVLTINVEGKRTYPGAVLLSGSSLLGTPRVFLGLCQLAKQHLHDALLLLSRMLREVGKGSSLQWVSRHGAEEVAAAMVACAREWMCQEEAGKEEEFVVRGEVQRWLHAFLYPHLQHPISGTPEEHQEQILPLKLQSCAVALTSYLLDPPHDTKPLLNAGLNRVFLRFALLPWIYPEFPEAPYFPSEEDSAKQAAVVKAAEMLSLSSKYNSMVFSGLAKMPSKGDSSASQMRKSVLESCEAILGLARDNADPGVAAHEDTEGSQQSQGILTAEELANELICLSPSGYSGYASIEGSLSSGAFFLGLALVCLNPEMLLEKGSVETPPLLHWLLLHMATEHSSLWQEEAMVRLVKLLHKGITKHAAETDMKGSTKLENDGEVTSSGATLSPVPSVHELLFSLLHPEPWALVIVHKGVRRGIVGEGEGGERVRAEVRAWSVGICARLIHVMRGSTKLVNAQLAQEELLKVDPQAAYSVAAEVEECGPYSRPPWMDIETGACGAMDDE